MITAVYNEAAAWEGWIAEGETRESAEDRQEATAATCKVTPDPELSYSGHSATHSSLPYSPAARGVAERQRPRPRPKSPSTTTS